MDPLLRAARERHEHARACLEAMRLRTARLRASGGDRYADEAAGALLAGRVAALADDGTAPLFFGRLDYTSERASALGGSAVHIGRRHIHDSEADPVVIDWRAEVARAFYRASTAEPMGLERRHRFGFSEGELTSVETEVLATGEGAGLAERALAREIERPRVGPMRDIVATIQPEQDDLIRAPLDDTLCVQGSPGTGKTAVGLHRAAFLAYEHRAALERRGILVIGPNPAFMSYIAQVLPGLGETRIRQVPLEELAGGVVPVADDGAETAWLKGQPVMAEVIARAVAGAVRPPEDAVTVRVHGLRERLEARELRALLARVLRSGVPYSVARRRFSEGLERLLLQRLERRGAAAGRREAAKALATAGEARAMLAATWPPLDPVAVVARLLSDPAHLHGCAAGLLDAEQQRRLAWARKPRSRREAPWSPADAFLVDEAAALIERPPGVGHVVLDEAQDCSPMQLRAIGRRCRHGSATLLGDLAQATAPWAVERWEDALAHLGKPGGRLVELPRAFRAPRAVLELASGLLPLIGVDVTPAAAVREVPGAVELHRVEGPVADAAAARTREALGREGSIGVIAAPADVPAVGEALARAGVAHERLTSFEAPARVTLVPAVETKGLEFDQVVVCEPAAVAELDAAGPRWLYIALTRAVSRLVVVHRRGIPGLEAAS